MIPKCPQGQKHQADVIGNAVLELSGRGADRQTLNFLRFGATLAPNPGTAHAVSQLQAA